MKCLYCNNEINSTIINKANIFNICDSCNGEYSIILNNGRIKVLRYFNTLKEMISYKCNIGTKCVFNGRVYEFDGSDWEYKFKINQ